MGLLYSLIISPCITIYIKFYNFFPPIFLDGTSGYVFVLVCRDFFLNLMEFFLFLVTPKLMRTGNEGMNI